MARNQFTIKWPLTATGVVAACLAVMRLTGTVIELFLLGFAMNPYQTKPGRHDQCLELARLNSSSLD